MRAQQRPEREAANVPVRRVAVASARSERRLALLGREWLTTNGLGGYASGTLGGAPSRRYHGMLVAALPPPLGRYVMVADVNETLQIESRPAVPLTARSTEAAAEAPLEDFRLEAGLPVWRYVIDGVLVERRVSMPHGQNTTIVRYELLAGAGAVELLVDVGLQPRPHDSPVDAPIGSEPTLKPAPGGYEIDVGGEAAPALRLRIEAPTFALLGRPQWLPQRRYAIEESRGYMHTARTWSPGRILLALRADQPIGIHISTESWNVLNALDVDAALVAEIERRVALVSTAGPNAAHGLAAELVLAADQFIVSPVGRAASEARVHASGEQERSVIAGYHWFTDWGRDTMISLEGLTLCTGRPEEAKHILHTFAANVRDGLLPNLFPEGGENGLYHTADATLWFFHAIDRYVSITNDRTLLTALLPRLVDIAEHHLAGTRFGIAVDVRDDLLRQGAPGFQLTWMDAKVGDWVVTPRRGKAVEINALWYNALCLLSTWLRDAGAQPEALRYQQLAARTRASFNRRFWNDATQHLFDVVDGETGDDPACRPNQLFAISLPHAVLDRAHWHAVLAAVETQLLTPYGLRTLSPRHRDYQPRYHGDLRSRDAAYHQGTVWPWLIGALFDARRRVHPDDTEFLERMLAAFHGHLSDEGIGSISEIFDAEPPFAPRGCLAQAWSVAEVLRCTVALRAHSRVSRAR